MSAPIANRSMYTMSGLTTLLTVSQPPKAISFLISAETNRGRVRSCGTTQNTVNARATSPESRTATMAATSASTRWEKREDEDRRHEK